MNDNQSFIFTHIPKCGGTSFREFIFEACVNSNIDSSNLYIPGLNNLAFNKNLSQLTNEELRELTGRELKVLANHSKHNEHIKYGINLQNPFCYTILREPVDRFISHYNFFYYQNGLDGLKGIPFNQLGENEKNRLLGLLSNLQTKYLANTNSISLQAKQTTLKVAKFNLLFEFDSYGILENLEESIQNLKAKAPDWLKFNTTTLNIKNKTKKRIEYSEEIINKIKINNILDIELYNFALKYFGKDLRGELVNFPKN